MSDRVSFSVNEVAEMVGVCRRTIYNEIENARLKSYKVGARRLVSRKALDEWLQEREKEAA